MKRLIQSFLKSDRAVTAMEYGMIAALLAIGLIAVLAELRGGLVTTLQNIRDELSTPDNPPQ